MKNSRKQKGVVVIIVFLIMGLLLLLGFYFLGFSLSEKKISASQEVAGQAYYLAEAGINEAIWKLKNDTITGDGDDAWANDFIDEAKNPAGGPYWSDSFSHSFSNGSYNVSIQNSERGAGSIISVAKIPAGNGKYAQRIVKVSLFKGLASPVNNSAFFTGTASGNISISSSNITVSNGNVFCSNIFNISSSALNIIDNGETEEILEGQILAAGNLNQSSSTITSEAICAFNACTENCADYTEGKTSCPVVSTEMIKVDFDSDDPNSFKSRALTAESLGQCQILCNGSPCSTKCILNKTDFEDLTGDITINSKITYVTGNISISGKTAVINGILVSAINKKISISSSSITINRPDEQSPSGLLSGGKIDISSSTLNVQGIIYSSQEMTQDRRKN